MNSQEITSVLLSSSTDNAFQVHFEGRIFHFPKGLPSEIRAELVRAFQQIEIITKQNPEELNQSIIEIIELLTSLEWIPVDQNFDILENMIYVLCYNVIPSLQEKLAFLLHIFESEINESRHKHQTYLGKTLKESALERRCERLQSIPVVTRFLKKLHARAEAKKQVACRSVHMSNEIVEIYKRKILNAELITFHLSNLMAVMVTAHNKTLDESIF